MRTPAAVLALAAAVTLTAGLRAESDKTWIFPALVYGPSQWSLVRIANRGTSPVAVRLEAYTERGMRINVPAQVEIAPGRTEEFRLQPTDQGSGYGWARVAAAKEVAKPLKVDAVTEYLQGNKIQWLGRDQAQLSDDASRYLSPPEKSILYLLNASSAPVTGVMCWTDRANDSNCQYRTSAASRFTIPANAALVGGIGNRRARYFMTHLNGKASTALLIFTPAKGTAKTFSTESSVFFEEEDPAAEPAPTQP